MTWSGHVTCDLTERSFKARFLEHKRPSSSSSEVSPHINKDKPEYDVHIDKAQILDRDPDWFTRRFLETIYIRAHKPTLYRDGGRYNLPAIWTRLVRSHVTRPDQVTVNSLEFYFQYGVESKIYEVNGYCISLHN